MKPNSGLFADLQTRGLVKQVTDPGIADILDQRQLTVYAGFDPTSDSLHVGSLLPILTLRRFQQAGHRVIAVVGGATGMIGDPSGKSHERSLLNSDQLKLNLAGITTTLSHFLDLKGPNPVQIMNNADWFQGVSYLDFLRDIGKHFTINHMTAKESIRARLEDREHGISYTEFSYMLLQSYDFYILNQREGCRLQVGGSDQWGNITAGIELIRRMRALPKYQGSSEEVFGLTHPLVTKSDGGKFGKTEQGTLWLSPGKTSAYAFYQFFMQVADVDIGSYLRYFSFLPIEEIKNFEHSLQMEPEKRLAQRALARELTELVHGPAELSRVERASQALFAAEIRELDAQTLLEVMAGAPSTQKHGSTLDSGLPIVDLLVETTLCQSKGAARKDLTAGGIYVNNVRILEPAMLLKKSDLIAEKFIVLRKGKRTYHLIIFN